MGELGATIHIPMNWRENLFVSHEYARMLTPKQIVQYRDAVLADETRMLGEIFVDFLKKNHLPSIPETVKRIRSATGRE